MSLGKEACFKDPGAAFLSNQAAGVRPLFSTGISGRFSLKQASFRHDG